MPKQQWRKRSWQTVSWLFATLFFLSNVSKASPWVDPGDERLRHHITVLADAGIIKTPITSWPITWGAIVDGIHHADTSDVTDAVAWSLEYVKFCFKQQDEFFNGYAYGGIRSDVSAISNFGTDQREKKELKAEMDWLGDRLALRLRGTWTADALDEDELRYDGSYIAGMLGNWIMGVGAIDRWWGPGWQSSLILSTAARPVDSVFLQRNFSDPFDVPILSWLGTWSITAFAGQLEKEREIPDAKLLGARFAFRPFSNLEIGLSRTAQWGGEGRPQSLSSLWDLVIGNDNRGDNGINEDNEPGNQMGAVDWRLGGSFFNTHSAVYMQYVGEDESGALPTRGTNLYGIETAFASGTLFHRFTLEFTDSMTKGDFPNYAYEHGIYKSGYRYHGRPLGASVDNDSRILTLSGEHYFSGGSALEWRIHKLDINRDRTNLSEPGGSVFGLLNHETELVEIAYSSILADLKITVSVQNSNDEIYWNNQIIKGAGGAIAFEYKL